MTAQLLLARLHPDGAHPDARRDCNPRLRARRDDMHKTLGRLTASARRDGGVLWRYEPVTGSVLVQSSARPDLSRLADGYGTMDGPHDMTAHLDRLAVGQTVAFRLVANPVVRRRDGRHGPRCREPVTGAAQQKRWLSRQLHAAGLDTAEEAVRAVTAVEPHPRGGKARLHVVEFDGVAEICDAGRLRSGVAAGVGPSKSWGCGLLTVSRPL